MVVKKTRIVSPKKGDSDRGSEKDRESAEEARKKRKQKFDTLRSVRKSLSELKFFTLDIPPPIDLRKPRLSIKQVTIDKDRPYPRLPSHLKPISYNIFLIPILELFTFSGKVFIIIKILKPTDTLVLNSFELEIESVTVFEDEKTGLDAFNDASTFSGGERLRPSFFMASDSSETLEISLDSIKLPKSTFGVLIEFHGSINNQYTGFCVSRSINRGIEDGHIYMAMSHPCNARKIFPCFDEPTFPATFRIGICVPKRMVVLCNTPIRTTLRGPMKSYKEVIFQETPLIAPSNVGFVIGVLHSMSEDVNGLHLAVHSAPHIPRNCLSKAIQLARKAIEWFQNFGTEIPSPAKLDIVAVQELSSDYITGLGLAVCLESHLVYDDTANETGSRGLTLRKIASAMANIVSTQWFQNVLPNLWWSNTWAYFGVIKYVETGILEEILMGGDVESSGANLRKHVFHPAMRLDCLDVIHPLQRQLQDPSNIEESIDEIQVLKSTAIMRMWSALAQEEHISTNVNYLLQKPSGEILKQVWLAVGLASPKFQVETELDVWTKLPGYPLLTLSEESSRGTKQCSFVVSQERFFGSIEDAFSRKKNIPWPVALNISTSINPLTIITKEIGKSEKILITLSVRCPEWINLNAGGKGYFRVCYPPEMMDMMRGSIRRGVIPPVDRIVLLNDSFEMALSGYHSMSEVLKTLRVFTEEESPAVWLEIDNVVQRLDYLMSYATRQIYQRFQTLILGLYATMEIKYGRDAFDAGKFQLGSTYTHEHLKSMSWFKMHSLDFFLASRENVKCVPGIGMIRRHDKLLTIDLDGFFTAHGYGMMYSLILRRFLLFGHSETIQWARERYVSVVNGSAEASPDSYGTLLLGFALARPTEETLHLVTGAYRFALHLETREIIMDGFIPFQNTVLLRSVLQFAISSTTPINHTAEILVRCGTSKLGRTAVWLFFKEHVAYFSRQFYRNEQLLKPLFRKVLAYFVTEEMYQDVRSFFQEHVFQGLAATVEQTLDNIRRNFLWIARDLKQVSKSIEAHVPDSTFESTSPSIVLPSASSSIREL